MIDELKIEYCFRERKTNERINIVLDIGQVERQNINPNPFSSLHWEMLKRKVVEFKSENASK